MTQAEFLDFLKAEVKKMGSARTAARKLGVSAVYLCDILNGNRPAGDKICKALGVVRSVKVTREYTYERE